MGRAERNPPIHLNPPIPPQMVSLSKHAKWWVYRSLPSDIETRKMVGLTKPAFGYRNTQMVGLSKPAFGYRSTQMVGFAPLRSALPTLQKTIF